MALHVNTIVRCEARLANGDFIVYSDWEDFHIRQSRFAAIMAGPPVEFSAVTTDGERFTVDLVTGCFRIGQDHFAPDLALHTPLRLIYYKRMGAGAGEEPTCDYFVVGWQTTVDGKNLKVGIKVDPSVKTWQITEDI